MRFVLSLLEECQANKEKLVSRQYIRPDCHTPASSSSDMCRARGSQCQSSAPSQLCASAFGCVHVHNYRVL